MEEIIFDDYDECESEKKSEVKVCKNHCYSNGIRKCALALAFAVAVSTGFSAVPGKFNNMATVEAARKKDKKKPVIKLSGQSNIRVTQNESVKIPKATAKDNVDGNITKKIKVSVKSGKKSYASIAKKIRKNKAVKFSKTGKYTITYTVSDKAKNKATKKCTVTVVAKQENKKTTEDKITAEQTTENKTTTEQVMTAATTETSTTEDNVKMPDMSKYGTMGKVTVNGEEYNILTVTDAQKYSDDIEFSKQAGELSCSKMFVYDFGYDSTICEYNDNHKYLEFFGKISIVDEYDVDCSNNIFIVEKETKKKFYYANSKGEFRFIASCNMVSFDFLKEFGTYTYIDEANKICINGQTFDKIYH